tara:strand:- start:12 stop:491 length:480 start_codon:yes stop_codon:yes gene_type:complete
MFEKKSSKENQNKEDNSLGVFRPSKGSAKVVIGNGVTMKGEITNADEVQIDGQADVTVKTDNLVVGGTGDLKGNITSENADVWGKLEGDLKVLNTLTIQEQGTVSGKVEYQSLQIKLGGKLKGQIKSADKVKNFSDHVKKEDENLDDKDSSNLSDEIKK